MQTKKRRISRRYIGVTSYLVFMLLNLLLFQNCKEQGYSINASSIQTESAATPNEPPPITQIEETAEAIKQKICKDTPSPQIVFSKSEFLYYQNQVTFEIDIPDVSTDKNPHAAIKSVSCRYKHLNADDTYESFKKIDCQLVNNKVNLTFTNTAAPFRQVYFEINAINDCGKSKVMQSKVNSTTRYLQTTAEKLRFIFVVDNSGSNYDAGSGAATDPDRSKRFNAMKDFKAIFSSASTNISFGYVEFGGLIRYFQKEPVNFSVNPFYSSLNLTEFGTALELFKFDTFINNGTKFSLALQTTHDLIKANIDSESALPANQRAKNFIIFLSDGKPSESDILAKQNAQTIDEWALSYINNYLQFSDIDENGLSLSTLYYGSNNNVAAAALMESLALQGSGKFFNASESDSIDLQGLINAPAEIAEGQY